MATCYGSILSRAVHLVLADPKQTLLVTGPGLALLLGSSLMAAPGSGSLLPVPLAADNRILLSAFLKLAALAMIVITWHRYVLLDGSMDGGPNQLTLSTFGAYAIAAVKVGLIVLLSCVIILTPAVMLVNAVFPDSAPLIQVHLTRLSAVILSGWLTFRLGLMLPAAAIGTRFSLRASWVATGPLALTLVRLAVLVALLSLAFDFVASVLWSASAVVSTTAHVVMLYIEVLLTAGIISTLYGVLAQGRRI